MFGMESELAVSGSFANGAVVPRDMLARWLMRMGSETLPHLQGFDDNGIFLANGARFYVDAGFHPEMTTPECTNPWDVVRYQLAGEAILNRLATLTVERHDAFRDVLLFKSNVDYQSGTTWGCHESYLCHNEPAFFHQQLLPHLVTRSIYTGAGGLVPAVAGIEFALTPRAWFITTEVSSNSTDMRPLLHLRDDPLNRSCSRLHLICGDNARAHLATWLRFGTTALVVAMIDAGLQAGEGLQLRQPVKAMRRVAADTSLRMCLPLLVGRAMTALDVQRLYLERAEAHLRDAFMPPWAPEVCNRWRQTLDALEASPEQCARSLDWAMKLELFRGRLSRHGYSLTQLAACNRSLARLAGQARRAAQLRAGHAELRTLDQTQQMREELRRLVDECGSERTALRKLLDVKDELLEIDARFSQLGDESLFARLERSGELRHQLPGVDNIEHAMEHPPLLGRARVRGELIRRLSGDPNHRAGWQCVIHRDGRYVDLEEPFTDAEVWSETGRPGWLPDEPLAMRRLRRRALTGTPPDLLQRILDGTRL